MEGFDAYEYVKVYEQTNGRKAFVETCKRLFSDEEKVAEMFWFLIDASNDTFLPKEKS